MAAVSDIARIFATARIIPRAPTRPDRATTIAIAHRFESMIDDLLNDFPATTSGRQDLVNALIDGIVAGMTGDFDYIAVRHDQIEPGFVLASAVAIAIHQTHPLAT